MMKYLLVFLFSTLAHAKSININPLLTGLNSSYLGLEDASLSDQPFSNRRTPGRTFIYVNYHMDNAPWVRLTADKKKKVENVVSSMQTIDLGMSWLMGDNMQLSFQTFGSLVNVAPQYGSDSASHIGDSRIQFKYRFLTETYWSMAVAPEITLPTGVEYTGHPYGASLSNSSFAPGARIIGEYRTNQIQWTFNLGYTYYDQAEFKSPNQDYPRVDGRSRIFLGSGSLLKLSNRWALNSEYSSQLTPGVNHFTPPGLFTVGARYQPSNSLSWNFGLGTGALGSVGGNDSVIYAGFKVPLFGSSRTKNRSDRYEDPLLREAYKKNLIDNSEDQTPLQNKEVEPYFKSEPVEQENFESNSENEKSTYSPSEERTRRALFN